MTRTVPWSVAFLAAIAAGAAAQFEPNQITSGDYRDADPAVSPDGAKLAFASNRTGKFNIFIYDLRTKGAYQLTESADEDRRPSWSADGLRLLFDSRRTGSGDLFEVEVERRAGFLQVTDQPAREAFGSYAPKGRGLLYARDTKRALLRRATEVVLRPDAASGPASDQVLGEGDEPRFSPDGSRIVFVSRRTGNDDIWLMPVEGRPQTQLTSSPKDDNNPCFSPGGDRVAFASKRTGNYEIYVMDADGGRVRQITSHPSDDTQPCWGGGDFIYFTRQSEGGSSSIWRVKAPAE